jgi:hypothetical protein
MSIRIKEGNMRLKEIQGKSPCDDRGRDQSDLPTSKRTLRFAAATRN